MKNCKNLYGMPESKKATGNNMNFQKLFLRINISVNPYVELTLTKLSPHSIIEAL